MISVSSKRGALFIFNDSILPKICPPLKDFLVVLCSLCWCKLQNLYHFSEFSMQDFVQSLQKSL